LIPSGGVPTLAVAESEFEPDPDCR
jgi:hypothetical protein